MTTAGWYIALASIGIGASIPLYWLRAARAGGIGRLAGARPDFRFHVAAEIATGIVLLAGGAGMALAGDPGWARASSALGFGMLAYTLIESPGHYLSIGDRRTAATLLGTWVVALPAIVLHVASA